MKSVILIIVLNIAFIIAFAGKETNPPARATASDNSVSLNTVVK